MMINNIDHSTARNVAEILMEKDNFIKWLGISVIEAAEGYSKIQLTVREEMLNALGIAHGGVIFSLADSAFGLAGNSRKDIAVAWDTSITFIKSSKLGDVLIAEAREYHSGKNTGMYLVTISNQHNDQVALFKGTCFKIKSVKK